MMEAEEEVMSLTLMAEIVGAVVSDGGAGQVKVACAEALRPAALAA
jgi:hypothetical protein